MISTESPPPRTNRSSKVIREILETVALTVLIFLLVRVAVQNFRVDGTSMLPTVHSGDLVLVNKVDYLLHPPERGDVIVFRFPLNTQEDFIKRVIGVPGNVVRVRAFQGVWVNGQKLSEPYILQIPNYNFGPVRVPNNDFFVLGDNRNDSYDSHEWLGANNKPAPWVPRGNIIGKVLISYWPLTDLKFFSF